MTVPAFELRRFCGGKGANQAVAAARLGGRVRMVGRVGDDEAGCELVAALTAIGVDVEHAAVHFANRAAALSVTRPGAQASMPTRAELDRFHAPV